MIRSESGITYFGPFKEGQKPMPSNEAEIAQLKEDVRKLQKELKRISKPNGVLDLHKFYIVNMGSTLDCILKAMSSNPEYFPDAAREIKKIFKRPR